MRMPDPDGTIIGAREQIVADLGRLLPAASVIATSEEMTAYPVSTHVNKP